MYFIKLIRPINLAIIVLTMYGLHFYIKEINYFQKVDDNAVDFFLLVFSTVLIAAAGNIINDYFDVKADRINKPEKLIITKHVKRRWAILTHWGLNGIAFCIGVYLSIKYSSLWMVFIHLLSINILWFYSMLFKRKVLIGNLLIAFLTALVPLLVMIYFKVGNSYHLTFSEFEPDSWIAIIDYHIVYFMAGFAFVQNLAREIVKDAQDVKGDEQIHARSLPMVIGEWKSLKLVSGLLVILPLFLIYYLSTHFQVLIEEPNFFSKSIPFALSALLNILVIIMIFTNTEKKLKLYHLLIKLSMLIGVLTTFYIAYINK